MQDVNLYQHPSLRSTNLPVTATENHENPLSSPFAFGKLVGGLSLLLIIAYILMVIWNDLLVTIPHITYMNALGITVLIKFLQK